jgi:Flp pilus assembly protein TadD
MNPGRRNDEVIAASIGLAALLLLLTSCASAPPPDPWRRAERELAELGWSLERIREPVRLTSEMEAWVRERIGAGGSNPQRLELLLREIQAPDGLGVEYQAGYTATAREVFAERRANCLALTHLLVALARELHISAYYMRVSEVDSYEKHGDLVVHSGHVTAGFGSGAQRRVLEWYAGPEADYRMAQPLSDRQGLALHYSNRGAELLREGQTRLALEQSRVAVALAPELPDAWLNLGVGLRRTGDLSGAEAAYRAAVQADPDFFPAYNNLAALVFYRGDRDAAQKLLRLLDRRANRNPFTYLALGDLSLAEGRLDEARRFYRRAVRLEGQSAEARAAMGGWALAAGRPAEAIRWLDRATAIDPSSPRVERLAAQLAAGDG